MSKQLIITLFVFIGLLFLVGGYFMNQSYHSIVKMSPKMFVYQTFFGPANSAFIIEDLKYKEALIAYYDTIANNPNANPVIEMPLKTLPQYEPVYVMGYSEDSTLVDIVSYYDRGAYFGGSYLRGWVYIKTLHENPPKKLTSIGKLLENCL